MDSFVAAKHKAFSRIRTFAEFLVQNLPESYEDQRKKLVDISINIKIFDSVNLIQLKLSIKKYKEDIIFILQVLKYEDLKFLEAVSKDKIKSEFLENFFEFFYVIAKIHERIDKINANPPIFANAALAEMVAMLCNDYGFVQMAKEASYSILNESLRESLWKWLEGKEERPVTL